MIGILGGTFDPVHFAHLRCALELQQHLGLDEVRFVPSRQPPHRGVPFASTAQRVDMLGLAIEGQAGFVIDERELERDGPSYTVDTLISLKGELDPKPLCLIIGMDAFMELHRWDRWERLIELAHLIVMRRPGRSGEFAPPLQSLLDRHAVSDPVLLRRRSSGCIILHPVTQIEISATRIRELIAGGENARYLLPDRVLEYIRQERLYLDADSRVEGAGA